MATAFDIETFHRRAVETPSHDSVDEMRELVLQRLREAGAAPGVDEAGNVLATRGGDGFHLVFNTHLDTVPPHKPYGRLREPPSGGREEWPLDPAGDVICGRGACDAKASLTAMVDAFLRADPDDTRVTLAFSVDEETLQTGGAHLAETLSYDAVVVGEPTGLDVCPAARGQFEGDVTVDGESAHAGDPDSGDNAIRAAAPVIEALARYDEERGPDEHELLGDPTLTPTMITGGQAPNRVPDEVTITFDRRPVPPETVEGFRADLADYLDASVDADCSVELMRPDTPFPTAFATDPEGSLVETLQVAGAGEVRPFGAATEASYFADDAPTVVFGPGDLSDEEGAIAHSEREFVHLGEMEFAADVLRRVVEHVGG